MAHKSFKLEEGETILAVVPESCLGPGGCWRPLCRRSKALHPQDQGNVQAGIGCQVRPGGKNNPGSHKPDICLGVSPR